MKLKFLSSLLVPAVLGIVYFTFSSNANGGNAMGKSTTGCGGVGCHGTAASANSTAQILNLPTTFETGKTYTIVVGGMNATKAKAGFDLSCSAGSFGANGTTNIMVMGTEVHHTAPATAVSGIAGWSLTWTAPSTPSNVTFNLAYNAVDGNNSESNDEWDLFSTSVPGSWPADVQDVNTSSIKIYPNPVVNKVSVQTNDVQHTEVAIFDAQGKQLSLSPVANTSALEFDFSTQANGTYVLKINENGKVSYKHITKK